MIIKSIFKKMQTFAQNSQQIFQRKIYYDCQSYEDAIDALNSLQSNAQYLKNMKNKILTSTEEHANTILETQKYLLRSGLSLDKLDDLSAIHVTGTKGKGSTCALCESILREHGFRTGFFSSPHLFEIRERIRINGKLLEKNVFTQYFWEVYSKIRESRSHPNDMPEYFKFLTVLAFNVFVAEKVDVAVIEVGIGGEYDCTNILRKVPVVGITSLGLDHTTLLGNTLEKIAWHKGGIMKKGCQAFTVPQEENTLEVLKGRSKERDCSLQVVNLNLNLQLSWNILQVNASLATILATTWISFCSNKSISEELIKKGISDCFWPGRFQIFYANEITYYLDGAHTLESLRICREWFLNKTKVSTNKKVLIFNATGDRDSENMLQELQLCCFDYVYFVPNVATSTEKADNINYNITENEQLKRCCVHKNIWLNFNSTTKNRSKETSVTVHRTIYDVLQDLPKENKYNILVTGSLHLVGAMLSLLDPNLNGNRAKHLQAQLV